jgi:hypothetical protein
LNELALQMRRYRDQVFENEHSNLLEMVVALNAQPEPREFPRSQLNGKSSEQ